MIIGITGTLGAGKGTVVEYLKTKGFKHYSGRQFLYEEIDRRGMERNRDSLNAVGEELRATHGPGYLVEEQLKRAQAVGGDIVIESIRTVGEVEALRVRGALLWAVDADPKTRYERVALRGSETDKISYEKFLADEERESIAEDKGRMNLRKCIAMADVVLTNNGTQEELFAQVEAALQKYTQK
ncbi:hypothetical protein A3F55_01415 [Candidatus Adlerbacteria bacterium RIFCSPHIGHO2_12_FULL_53_18]|uniref:Dephospho-CoA kinase n=1 Tax=Candidatus Adlerbacteria bacterium RIFCSPHIGHO2_12_FULL_53_18 TaxID=1797242 RepID=A0A1F4XU49_9BACT|nr:MAG: hypothetical protein A3F55_01415 [Candidatus Adlerbacteria bacterium RIFCSPHIGHO2_12_FULL_53_18]